MQQQQQQQNTTTDFINGVISVDDFLYNYRIWAVDCQRLEIYGAFMKKISENIIPYLSKKKEKLATGIAKICNLVKKHSLYAFRALDGKLATHPQETLDYLSSLSLILIDFDNLINSVESLFIRKKLQMQFSNVWLQVASQVVYIDPQTDYILQKKFLSIISHCMPLHNFCHKICAKAIQNTLKQFIQKKRKYRETDSVHFEFAIILSVYSQDYKCQHRAATRIMAEIHKFPRICDRNRHFFQLAANYISSQTHKVIDTNVEAFIEKCMIPSQLLVSIMELKKHSEETPLLGQKQIRHHRYLQGIANTVHRLYRHQNPHKLRVQPQIVQYNLKAMIDLTFKEFKMVELEIIDLLLLYIKLNSVTNLALSQIYNYCKEIVPYIFFVLFTGAVYPHEAAFPSILDVGKKVLASFDYLEGNLLKAKQIAETVEWSERVKTQDGFFLVSFLLFSLSLGQGAYELYHSIEGYCMVNIHPDSYRSFVIGIYNELDYSEKPENVFINVEYTNQLHTLTQRIPRLMFSHRINYRICYYDIHSVTDPIVQGPADEQGNPPVVDKMIRHAGVDETGLTRNCIQACIDEFMAKPYVKRDEDDKIYFDFTGMTDLYVSKEGAQLGYFLAFILTSCYECHLPIKEEIIKVILSPNSKPYTVQGGYHSLPSGVMNTLALMERDAKTQEEHDNIVETQIEQIKHCGKKYIESCKDFCVSAHYAICHTDCDALMYFDEEYICRKLYATIQIDADIIIKSMTLSAAKDSDVEEAREKFELLKQLFIELDNANRIRFVKLVRGNLADKSSIIVYFDSKIVIPVWQSCGKVIKIGSGLCKKWLDFSLENAIGFHAV